MLLDVAVPPSRRRRATTAAVYRRRRLALACVALVGLGGALVAFREIGSGGSAGTSAPASSGSGATKLELVAQSAKPLPAPISGETATTINGRVYIIGGLDSAGASVSGVFSFDPATGGVSQAGTL